MDNFYKQALHQSLCSQFITKCNLIPRKIQLNLIILSIFPQILHAISHCIVCILQLELPAVITQPEIQYFKPKSNQQPAKRKQNFYNKISQLFLTVTVQQDCVMFPLLHSGCTAVTGLVSAWCQPRVHCVHTGPGHNTDTCNTNCIIIFIKSSLLHCCLVTSYEIKLSYIKQFRILS